MLVIKDDDIHPYNVTLASAEVVGQGDQWVFVPFDDDSCDLYAASPAKVFAFGNYGGCRVFDVPTRTCVIDAAGLDRKYHAGAMRWAWSEAESALYVTHARLVADPREHRTLVRRITTSGEDHIHVIPGMFGIETMTARDDGRLFIFAHSHIKPGYVAATIDFAANKISTEILGNMGKELNAAYMCVPRWPSWDGRLVIRPHVSSIPRADPTNRRKFDPLNLEPDHPDLAGVTEKCYGIAIDLFNTAPFSHARRIILRYVSPTEIQKQKVDRSFGPIDFAIVDQIADEAERHGPLFGLQKHAPRIFTLIVEHYLKKPGAIEPYTYSAAEKLRREQESHAARLLGMVRSISWDDDNQGFTVRFTDDCWRHIGLDGTVGPLQPWPDYRERMIPEKQRKPVIAAFRRKMSNTIKLKDTKPISLAAAMAKIASQMEKGLAKLINGGVLGWTFTTPDGKLAESEFYALVRAAPPSALPALLPPLTAIFTAYAAQIASVDIPGEQLYSLEHVEDEEENAFAALSEAAIAFATLDPHAHLLLKSWFASVDSEHDAPTIERVFTAIADRTNFTSADLIAFGLWFERSMVQTWKNSPEMAKLLSSAQQLFTPPEFAALIIQGCKADCDPEYGDSFAAIASRMQALLSEAEGPWARDAQTQFGILLSAFHSAEA